MALCRFAFSIRAPVRAATVKKRADIPPTRGHGSDASVSLQGLRNAVQIAQQGCWKASENQLLPGKQHYGRGRWAGITNYA